MPADALRSRIGSALANREFAEVEGAWRECATLHPEEYPYLLQVAGQLARFDKGALAGDLCLGLARTLFEKGDVAGAAKAARAALQASARVPGLRELLVEIYRKQYAGRADLERLLAKSGMGSEGSLRQQVEALDRYLQFEEGAYVFHRGGWGYGRVVEFDAEQEQMTVDFQKRKGHRIAIVPATRILERLPDEHFGVYLEYRADELRRIIQEDPARVFRIFLESHGRKAPLKNVREALVPAILSKEEWSRWWTRAKREILKDPRIKVGKGASPVLELRDRALSIEDEVAEKMAARASALEKCAVAREYLRTLDLTPELAAAIAAQAQEALRAEAEATPGRLALLYLLADLKQEGSAAAADEARRAVAQIADLGPVLAALEPSDRKRVLQDAIAAGGEDSAGRVAAILEGHDPAIAALAFDHLVKTRKDLAIAFLARLTGAPAERPDLFLWCARGLLDGSIPRELAPGETPDTLMDKLLRVVDQIGLQVKRKPDAAGKEFLRQVRSFLTARRCKLFAAYARGVTPDYARFLYAKILRNRGLTDPTKQALMDILEAEHPSVREAPEVSRPVEGELSDEFIYTTRAGYHKREAELRQIVEVEIPANAEDLGRAARFGDISENAEYSAALEKQAFLMRRLKELRNDLDRTRIIEPSEVTADKVVLGTRVRVRNLTRGLDEAFTILGPWDVDLERGVISYLSPVGRGLLGKTPGSTVEIALPEGTVTYSVLSVEPDPVFCGSGQTA
jgi:transcription elongation factor GreA